MVVVAAVEEEEAEVADKTEGGSGLGRRFYTGIPPFPFDEHHGSRWYFKAPFQSIAIGVFFFRHLVCLLACVGKSDRGVRPLFLIC